MTREDKQLLFKDLCARLPYGVIVKYKNRECEGDVQLGCGNIGYVLQLGNGWWKECKPYLRPMSSMIEEELYEVQEILGKGIEIQDAFISIIDSSINTFSYLELQAVFDWLNARHFDYRGLIEKGLALEAPEGMYKYENV